MSVVLSPHICLSFTCRIWQTQNLLESLLDAGTRDTATSLHQRWLPENKKPNKLSCTLTTETNTRRSFGNESSSALRTASRDETWPEVIWMTKQHRNIVIKYHFLCFVCTCCYHVYVFEKMSDSVKHLLCIYLHLFACNCKQIIFFLLHNTNVFLNLLFLFINLLMTFWHNYMTGKLSLKWYFIAILHLFKTLNATLFLTRFIWLNRWNVTVMILECVCGGYEPLCWSEETTRQRERLYVL